MIEDGSEPDGRLASLPFSLFFKRAIQLSRGNALLLPQALGSEPDSSWFCMSRRSRNLHGIGRAAPVSAVSVSAAQHNKHDANPSQRQPKHQCSVRAMLACSLPTPGTGCPGLWEACMARPRRRYSPASCGGSERRGGRTGVPQVCVQPTCQRCKHCCGAASAASHAVSGAVGRAHHSRPGAELCGIVPAVQVVGLCKRCPVGDCIALGQQVGHCGRAGRQRTVRQAWRRQQC